MDADATTARLAAGQNGGLLRKQLRELGLTDRQIDHRIASGVLEIGHRGAFRHVAVPSSWRASLHLAVLAAGGDAVASHRSAARLHCLEVANGRSWEITTRGSARPRQSGGQIHRTTMLESADRELVQGIPTTSIPRTLLDLGTALPFAVLEQAAQAAVIARRVQIEALVSVVERVGGRGRRGTAALRAVIRESLPDERLESMLELALHQLLLQVPGDPPVPQFELATATGFVRLDFAWPERRIAIEADGHRWHGTSQQLRRDLARSREIQALGWRHHRFGWSDIRERPDATLAELCRVAYR